MENNYYEQYEPIFGVWKLGKLLGEGSFGKVFEMSREDFGVSYKAALKTITIPSNKSEIKSAMAEGMNENSLREYFGGFVKELTQEFALMSKLKGNSNIVSYENHQVIEHKDEVGWDILIQMELLTSLSDYIAENDISMQDIIKLGIDICRALELCKKNNIVHRDIKPENIFVSDNGDYKLGDFGIARTVEKTTSGLSKKGTYTYMAPEIYKGNTYNSSVDIYSLGIVLYRLLNENRAPFMPPYPKPIAHKDREDALAQRLSGAILPPPSHSTPRLTKIVLKACAYKVEDRYQNPTDMKRDLERYLMRLQDGTDSYSEKSYEPTTIQRAMQSPSMNPYAGGYSYPNNGQNGNLQYAGGYAQQNSNPQYAGGYAQQNSNSQYVGGYVAQQKNISQYAGNYAPQQSQYPTGYAQGNSQYTQPQVKRLTPEEQEAQKQKVYQILRYRVPMCGKLFNPRFNPVYAITPELQPWIIDLARPMCVSKNLNVDNALAVLSAQGTQGRPIGIVFFNNGFVGHFEHKGSNGISTIDYHFFAYRDIAGVEYVAGANGSRQSIKLYLGNNKNPYTVTPYVFTPEAMYVLFKSLQNL